jgi:hypothetical protein
MALDMGTGWSWELAHVCLFLLNYVPYQLSLQIGVEVIATVLLPTTSTGRLSGCSTHMPLFCCTVETHIEASLSSLV